MTLFHGFGFCNVAVIPLRSEPSHRAEQVTQLLFGERAEIIEVNNKDWARVVCLWDGYEGWCRYAQLTVLSKKESQKPTKYLAGGHTSKLIMPEGELYLPLGSELCGLKGGCISPVKEQGLFKGQRILINELETNCEAVKNAVMQYLHAPYQWGGRSVAGIDCSGLTQMAYRLCNHRLERDASKQAKQGILIDFLQNARCGDLAFFDDKEGKIVHVGLLLDNQNIIHATDTCGRVVIDRIDMGGIISVSLRKRTHNLRMVRRMIKE